MPALTAMDLHAWLADHHPQEASSMAFMARETISPQTRDFLDQQGAHCLLEPFQKEQIHQVIDDLVANSELPCAAVCQSS